MDSILNSGHTAILLNGLPGDWIRCRNGLRQGDPLSATSSSLLRVSSNVSPDVPGRVATSPTDLLRDPPAGHSICRRHSDPLQGRSCGGRLPQKPP
jgi:hypothetical protein